MKVMKGKSGATLSQYTKKTEQELGEQAKEQLQFKLSQSIDHYHRRQKSKQEACQIIPSKKINKTASLVIQVMTT